VTAALGGAVLVLGLVGLAALPWAADDLEDVVAAAGGVRALVAQAWRRVRS
jgi:hypothetical protein